MATLGSFKVAIAPFIEGAGEMGKKITQDLGKDGRFTAVGKSMGGKIGKGMVTGLKIGAAGLGAAAAGIAGLGVAAVKAQAEIQQSLGGSVAVFEESSTEIQKWAAAAAGSMGISTNAALETANKMGSLFQGSGFNAEESATMTMEMSKRAADVASIMGVDLSAAMEAVTGAAKGNFTMMDNLGVAMNATTLQAYALSKGITTSWNEMSNTEKTGLAYQMFMEKTAKYAGNFEKENKTLAGSFDILRSSWQNVLYSMGDPEMLNAAIEQLAQAITNALGALLEILPTIIKSIGTMVEQLVPVLLEAVETLIPALVEMIETTLPPLIEALMTLLPVVLDSLLLIFTGIIDMLPDLIDGILTFLIDAFPLVLTAAVELFMAIVEALPTIIDTLVNRMPEIIETVVTGLVSAAPQILLAAFTALISILTAIPQLVILLSEKMPEIGEAISQGLTGMGPEVWLAAVELFEGVWREFTESMGKMVQIGVEIANGLWEGIKSRASWLKDKVVGWARDILNSIKGFFGIHSPSVIMRKEIGVQLGAGVGLGILDSGKSAIRDAHKFSSSVSDAINVSGGVDFGTSGDIGGRSGSGGVTVNQYLNEPKNMMDMFLAAKRGAMQGQFVGA